MKTILHQTVVAASLVILAGCSGAAHSAPPAVGSPTLALTTVAAPVLEVRLVTDEAEAALDIVDALRRGTSVSEEDWQRLFATEGYRRLKRREHAMGRTFEDAAFQSFLASEPVLSNHGPLAATLNEWKGADLSLVAGRALAYLPAGARLQARLYPVIKPQPNSFVFDSGTDSAAIFVYIDPSLDRAKFENVLAHELHHIGYAAACADSRATNADERLETAMLWMGAFGEGLAMLAAVGSADEHPHAVSDPEDRERWDRDVANAAADVQRLEAFFLDVIDGRVSGDAIRSAAMEFFGVQGPWYTVGWLMAATVEQAFGRDRLVAVMCEPHRLPALYNAAAEARNASGSPVLPLWSEAFLARIPGAAAAS